MAKVLDYNKTTHLVIRREEFLPEVTDVEQILKDWMETNKFKPDPEYGENYYYAGSLLSGRMFGMKYEIADNGDLHMYVHYSGSRFARPLDTKDVSYKARNRFSAAYHQLYSQIKAFYNPREMREIFGL